MVIVIPLKATQRLIDVARSRQLSLPIPLEGVLKVLSGQILCQPPDHDANHRNVDKGL
jgi:hypothetical protein